MDRSDEEVAYQFVVVLNDEEQYSLWPSDRPLPAGWYDAGFHGGREECLAYIQEHWTDIRPLSVRRDIQEAT